MTSTFSKILARFTNEVRESDALNRLPDITFFIEEARLAISHANSGDVIDIRPLEAALTNAKTATLVKTKTLEVIRLVIPAGKEIPEHRAHGEITVQCLEGRVAFATGSSKRDLVAGQMLYLSSEELHSLHGLEDSSVLVTILLK